MLRYLCWLLLPSLFSAGSPQPRRRCRYGDACWPDEATWQSFNESISGHLIRTFPSAAVCHGRTYDAEECAEAKEEWYNSFWRTNQTGAYTAILWELGNQQCFVNSTRDDPCQQGLVPYYSVAAETTNDIQAAVQFANEQDLYLVVKNTGHDHLGRSTGRGGFSIWTHQLKGRTWTDSFVVKDAPNGTRGIPAVTLQAGEQWLDVYRAAAKEGVIVVGGSARTVGAAGGWLTGGGHSAWSNLYGLGVDNVLEVTLVNAAGKLVTVNHYTDADYFYAIRGGGGSAWGVVTSVTYKTHPPPSHIQVGVVQINATTDSSLRPILERTLHAMVNITDAGYTGYGVFTPGLNAIFIRPNGTEAELAKGLAAFEAIGDVDGARVGTFNFTFPTWLDYCDMVLQDPNIALNVMDSSRLLTSDLALTKADQIVDLMLELPPDHWPAFNFIGKVNPAERNQTSVHPAWRDSRAVMSFGTNWNDTASEAEKRQKRQILVDISNRWQKIAGPEGGAYINEANPYEPKWQQVFWGANYERLLRIKRQKDPSNLFVCNRCVGSDVNFQP